MGDNVKRRHHTVPKFYLQRFANEDGQLIRVELPGERRHRISTGNATVENGFYLAETTEGDWVDDVENSLAEIEASAAEAIRQIVDDRVWPIPDEAREAVSTWTALQVLRTPAIRNQLNQLTDFAMKLAIGSGGKSAIREALEADRQGEAVTDDEVDAAWEAYTDYSSYSFESHPNEHLSIMFDFLPRAAEMFYQRGWSIIRFQRKSVITTDHPIGLVPPPDHEGHHGIGLATAGGILIPLDRRAILLMTDIGAQDYELDGTTSLSKAFNQTLAHTARRAIFHHPSDDPLNGIELPQPRTTEVQIGHQLDGVKFPEGMFSVTPFSATPEASAASDEIEQM